jgi:hypothetical protein
MIACTGTPAEFYGTRSEFIFCRRKHLMLGYAYSQGLSYRFACVGLATPRHVESHRAYTRDAATQGALSRT